MQLTAGEEYVVGIYGTWFQNVDYCVSNGMVLATFGCAEDVEDIYNLCKSISVGGICYLGYHDLDANGVWRFHDDSDTVDTEAEGSWFPGFPWDNSGFSLCGCMATWPTYTNSLAFCHTCNSYFHWGICEVLETAEPETICDDYLYIGDIGDCGIDYETAREECAVYGGELATVSEDDCDCLKDALSDKEAAWMGLNTLYHDPPFFEFDDGTDCPNTDNGRWSGACLGRSCWQNEKPINCNDGGSKCVAIGSDGLVNDIACGDKRRAILCNIGSGVPAKQIGELSLNIIHDNNGDGNTFTKHADKDIPLVGWLAFVVQVLLVLGLNICGCYYCLCRDNKKKEIADNSLIEYPNKI